VVQCQYTGGELFSRCSWVVRGGGLTLEDVAILFAAEDGGGPEAGEGGAGDGAHDGRAPRLRQEGRRFQQQEQLSLAFSNILFYELACPPVP
jgi:hypothetical protein